MASLGQASQNVNGGVLCIETAYDDLGRVQTVTSYAGFDSSTGAGTGTPVNQDEYAYDGWGNIVQEWQSQVGAVEETGETPTPSVQYVYDDGSTAADAPAPYVRLSDMIYPDRRDMGYVTMRCRLAAGDGRQRLEPREQDR